jgi:hypothetical protein
MRLGREGNTAPASTAAAAGKMYTQFVMKRVDGMLYASQA